VNLPEDGPKADQTTYVLLRVAASGWTGGGWWCNGGAGGAANDRSSWRRSTARRLPRMSQETLPSAVGDVAAASRPGNRRFRPAGELRDQLYHREQVTKL